MTSKFTSKRIPNYNPEDDTHEKIIKEFWLYSHWQERFERFGYYGSAIQAKHSLTRLKRLIKTRHQEINTKAKALHRDQNEDDSET